MGKLFLSSPVSNVTQDLTAAGRQAPAQLAMQYLSYASTQQFKWLDTGWLQDTATESCESSLKAQVQLAASE